MSALGNGNRNVGSQMCFGEASDDNLEEDHRRILILRHDKYLHTDIHICVKRPFEGKVTHTRLDFKGCEELFVHSGMKQRDKMTSFSLRKLKKKFPGHNYKFWLANSATKVVERM